ncbi:MAG: hypothetical protein MSA96_06470 [Treponema porcinum]|nr:hypothetical protein [Treponema porcinum]MCI7546408.1 hypothetical protein [Treponema porcinum]MDY5120950.1 hypothetical protein [Treponema porcinum]
MLKISPKWCPDFQRQFLRKLQYWTCPLTRTQPEFSETEASCEFRLME